MGPLFQGHQVKGPQYQGYLHPNLGMGPLFQGHLPPKLGVPTPNFRGRGPQYQGQFQSQYDPATKRTQFQTNQQKNSFTYNFYLMFQNFPALQTTRFQHFAKKGPPILGVCTPKIEGRPLILGVAPNFRYCSLFPVLFNAGKQTRESDSVQKSSKKKDSVLQRLANRHDSRLGLHKSYYFQFIQMLFNHQQY